ncbi:hypothetical protein QCD73_19035, partial [Bacillus sp. PsM16]|uniref:hypothetical protein n=1 Tax=Bacillus sp. PsM16 TaxID=3031172 RepID=UPI00263B6DBB
AYNWGTGNVDKAIKKNGENWKDVLPEETADYITKIPGYMKDGGEVVAGATEERTRTAEGSVFDYAARLKQLTY